MSKAKWIITDFETAEMIVGLLNKYEWRPNTKSVRWVIDLGKDEWAVGLFDEWITEPKTEYEYMKWFVRKYKEGNVYKLWCSIIVWLLAAIMLWWIPRICVTAMWWNIRDLVMILMLTWSGYSFALYVGID